MNELFSVKTTSVFTTTHRIRNVFVKCDMGELLVTGGWEAISSRDGFNSDELAETLRTNIEQGLETFFDIDTENFDSVSLPTDTFINFEISNIEVVLIATAATYNDELDLVLNVEQADFVKVMTVITLYIIAGVASRLKLIRVLFRAL